MKKFDVFEFGDEKAKKIAEIMTNKTSNKILEYLRKKEASETSVSKDLNIPMSTVHYNVQKLIENGLVEIKEFYWSAKGNKINIYKVPNKVIILAQERSPYWENKLGMILSIFLVIATALFFSVNLIDLYPGKDLYQQTSESPEYQKINIFDKLINPEIKINSCNSLTKIFSEAKAYSGSLAEAGAKEKAMTVMGNIGSERGFAATEVGSGNTASIGTLSASDYSETNIQVEGVDEADIVKTDGEYIYTVAKGRLIIAKAYPAENAKIASETSLGDFNPLEIFIDENKLLIFGYKTSNDIVYGAEEKAYPSLVSLTTVQLFDIGNRESPALIKVFDFEGNYLASRKIDDYVYIVVKSVPRYYSLENGTAEDIIPLYREESGLEFDQEKKPFKPITTCGQIEFLESADALNKGEGEEKSTSIAEKMPVKQVNPKNMIAVVSLSMSNNGGPINKKAIVGSGENVYVSANNLYIAEATGNGGTNAHKFALEDGEISYVGSMEVSGRVLNQFSMDEYNDHFRIATTIGDYGTNNIYIYDESLNQVGSLEGLAEGERIYSARFMGDKGYLVTFKRIDPLFVLDLSNPKSPRVLGQLKIPGYSDYIHPYDENHLIGIGKDTVESEEDFALFHGIKIALFDITDVENPKELHKVVIGQRGTDSEALRDHKAFLFDRDKNLLVIPIRYAAVEGAYVYDLTLYSGFDLKGVVEHRETKRSLYIENILYTISQNKIQLNSLGDLEKIIELNFSS